VVACDQHSLPPADGVVLVGDGVEEFEEGHGLFLWYDGSLARQGGEVKPLRHFVTSDLGGREPRPSPHIDPRIGL
jgi:hypothetical protein